MATKTRIRRSTWNTYKVTCYTHQVGTDARATGGNHHHQVRRTKTGHWQKRVVDANGNFFSPGPVEAIDAAEGEALFARAETY